MSGTLRLLQWCSVSVVIAAVAGCGIGGQQVEMPASAAQVGVGMLPDRQSFHQSDGGQSWTDRSAKADHLLYVSDAGKVHVYTYPNGKWVGTLTGFSSAAGECSDDDGNVWITNFNGASIVEYAHGGTRPIATLSDPGFEPQGCSVDPTTGDLAVAGY